MAENREHKEYRQKQNQVSATRKNQLDRGTLAARGHVFTPASDISGGSARLAPAEDGVVYDFQRALTGTIGGLLQALTPPAQRPTSGPLGAAHSALDAQEDEMYDSFGPTPPAAEYQPMQPDRGGQFKRAFRRRYGE